MAAPLYYTRQSSKSRNRNVPLPATTARCNAVQRHCIVGTVALYRLVKLIQCFVVLAEFLATQIPEYFLGRVPGKVYEYVLRNKWDLRCY
eukprot:1945855-Rhodomonas_salina.2